MSDKNSEHPDTPLVAAIDIGSNSCHLIVARIEHEELRPITRLKEKVQLGSGLDKDNNLTEEAIERGLACLRKLSQLCLNIDKKSIRIVGTSALRRAENSDFFVSQAEKILGLPVNIISGREEARLIYLGVAHTQSDDSGQRLVIDIGGGSTELIIGERFEPELLESLHLGCITYSMRYFQGGHLSEENFKAAYYSARIELLNIEQHYRQKGWSEAIGSSGTFKAITGAMQARGHHVMTRAGLAELRKELLSYKHLNGLSFNGIKPDRLNSLPGGLAITCAIFDSLDIESMSFSDGALREGLLYDTIGRNTHEDVRHRTLLGIQKRYCADSKQAARVRRHVTYLFSQTQHDWKLSDDEYETVKSAAMVHEIGLSISHNQFQQHGAYILRNTELLGFTARQQHYLTTLVRGHRRSVPLQLLSEFSGHESRQLLKLIILLRLAVLLNHQRTDYPTNYSVAVKCKQIQLTFPPEWLAQRPLVQANIEQEKASLARAGFTLEAE